jgi:uncharacterized damage-inducible protein DinB
MTLAERFLEELEREAPRTKRALQQVPTGRDDWKPHAKSMSLARLAGLVASMPSWVPLILKQDELDLTPPPGAGQYKQPATNELVQAHDNAMAAARAALADVTDDFLLNTRWRLRAGGKVVSDEARYMVMRETINHLAHHRGQLTVYLRLNDASVPAIYGPSADDPQFG